MIYINLFCMRQRKKTESHHNAEKIDASENHTPE